MINWEINEKTRCYQRWVYHLIIVSTKLAASFIVGWTRIQDVNGRRLFDLIEAPRIEAQVEVVDVIVVQKRRWNPQRITLSFPTIINVSSMDLGKKKCFVQKWFLKKVVISRMDLGLMMQHNLRGTCINVHGADGTSAQWDGATFERLHYVNASDEALTITITGESLKIGSST